MLGDIRRLTERCQEPLQKKLEDMLVPELTLQISWDQMSLEASRLLCTILGNLFCLTVEERRKEGGKEGQRTELVYSWTDLGFLARLATYQSCDLEELTQISEANPSTEILTPVLQVKVQMKRNANKLYSTKPQCQGLLLLGNDWKDLVTTQGKERRNQNGSMVSNLSKKNSYSSNH